MLNTYTINLFKKSKFTKINKSLHLFNALAFRKHFHMSLHLILRKTLCSRQARKLKDIPHYRELTGRPGRELKPGIDSCPLLFSPALTPPSF